MRGTSRPRVSVNMVMSLDGKISTRRREPARFSSKRDKQLLLQLRVPADAILAGGATVASDSMSMGIPKARLQRLRLRRGKARHPLRVIVSGTLGALRPGLKVFKQPISPVLIFCSNRAPAARRKFFSRWATVIVCGKNEVDLKRMCGILRRIYGVRRLHCEGGGALNGGLLAAGLIDELHLTVAPVLFGGAQAPTIADGPGVAKLRDARRFKLVSCRLLGCEVFLRYRRARDTIRR